MEKTNLIVAVFVAAVLAGLFMKFNSGSVMPMTSKEHFGSGSNNDCAPGNTSPCCGPNPPSNCAQVVAYGAKEHFQQKEVGMPLNSGGIGPYDGVSIGGGVSGWAANESAPILPPGSAPASQSDTSNQLMLLANNKVSHECCPSTFTNDVGCVCLTGQDRDLFASRGGNRA